MKSAIAHYSEINACEFSISEYLPSDLQSKVAKECNCCLCKINHKNQTTFDACVKKHPRLLLCEWSVGIRQTVCKTCKSSMVLNTKKGNEKLFCCIFDKCTVQLNSTRLLQDHYLKHLNVSKYECNICEKGYSKISYLKIHEKNHTRKSFGLNAAEQQSV